jgi:hypothetical protein
MRIQTAVLSCAAALLAAPVAGQDRRPPATQASPGTTVSDYGRYQSAFERYTPYKEPEIAPWREANEEVGRAGGHIGIFGGAQGGHAPSDKDKAPAGAPASDPHAGHGKPRQP